jgi:hypothetical protein
LADGAVGKTCPLDEKMDRKAREILNVIHGEQRFVEAPSTGAALHGRDRRIGRELHSPAKAKFTQKSVRYDNDKFSMPAYVGHAIS